MTRTQREDQEIDPQTDIALYPRWQLLFDKYDEDGDGRISLAELRRLIHSESYVRDIPKHAVKQILKRADEDENGYLDYQEFLEMIHSKETQNVMAHAFNRYVQTVVVQRTLPGDQVDVPGDYEKELSCCPPPVCMIIISMIQVIAFLWDVISEGESSVHGPVATLFIYNPFKRYEAWRFVTYMFVHVGWFHLVVNLVVQITLAIPLEMVHGWWRVLLVYLAGVIAGSLGTSVFDPTVYLAGASGGVYAIITAHVATIWMNWDEMLFPIVNLAFFIFLAAVDVGTTIYKYVLQEDSKIGYAAHVAGAVAGLLVGINVLRNLDVKAWERKVWWSCIILFTLLILTAIIWNAAFPSYFKPSI